jgi:hypothetical protein
VNIVGVGGTCAQYQQTALVASSSCSGAQSATTIIVDKSGSGTLTLNTGNTAPDIVSQQNGNKCEAHGSIQGRFVCTIAYGQGTKRLSWSVK